jgi:hypothetical protein
MNLAEASRLGGIQGGRDSVDLLSDSRPLRTAEDEKSDSSPRKILLISDGIVSG